MKVQRDGRNVTVEVTADGEGLVWHAGSALLAQVDGAAVFDTLMAEARSMRHADNTAQQTKAGLATERLTLPTVCLFICFAALLVYPAAVRLTGG